MLAFDSTYVSNRHGWRGDRKARSITSGIRAAMTFVESRVNEDIEKELGALSIQADPTNGTDDALPASESIARAGTVEQG